MYLDETETSSSDSQELGTNNNTNSSTSNNSSELVLSPISVKKTESDSYYHSSKSNMDYTADFTIDGNVTTCWQDGRDDDGVGDTLTYYFDKSTVNAVGIVNGNRKNKDSYKRNSRLAEITLSFFLGDDLVVKKSNVI